jgi:glycerophosphoryl diester phosphodiesterase
MELLRGDREVVRIGHRGAAALASENSLAAIEAAAAHGVDAVELDVVRVPDGRLVLAHGPPVPPDAPPLDDGLALAVRLGLGVQMDVKQPGVEAGVVEALRRSGLLDRSFVSSSSLRTLRAFAALEPGLSRSLTYPEDRLGLTGSRVLGPAVRSGLAALRVLLPSRLPRFMRAAGASAVTLNWTVVTPRAIDVCHRAGVAVYVWTVNEPALAKTLVDWGIDGIITDDPRLLLTLLPRGIRSTS